MKITTHYVKPIPVNDPADLELGEMMEITNPETYAGRIIIKISDERYFVFGVNNWFTILKINTYPFNELLGRKLEPNESITLTQADNLKKE